MQKIMNTYHGMTEIIDFLHTIKDKKVLLVTGKSSKQLRLYRIIHEVFHDITQFSDFTSNPDIDAVIKGIRLFQEKNCNFIIGLGGGSALDVAKAIRMYADIETPDALVNSLSSISGGTQMLAIPTTAGTGSESTEFSVIYHKGEKLLFPYPWKLPEYVILDAENLVSLSVDLKKAPLADALCQAVESYWSVNSTEESRSLAGRAISLICRYYKAYMQNDKHADDRILLAANLAGQAIEITGTTAVHAMSYKLTSMHHVPHGSAVGLLLPLIWEYMLEHSEQCIDKRGEAFFLTSMDNMAKAFDCNTSKEALAYYKKIFEELKPEPVYLNNAEELDILVKAVNINKLKSTPVFLNEEVIREIYKKIFNQQDEV